MNGCCCVEASTLVLMADGSQRPIRDLRIGDLVRTETGTAHIRDIIKGRESELIRIGLAQGGNLVATANHPLFTDKGVKRCSEVVVDDRLRTEGGCVAIESIELAPHEPATSNLTLGKAIGCVSHDFEVYNLVLDGSSVFFANGLLVGDDNEQGRLMRSSDEIRSSASVPAERLRRVFRAKMLPSSLRGGDDPDHRAVGEAVAVRVDRGVEQRLHTVVGERSVPHEHCVLIACS